MNLNEPELSILTAKSYGVSVKDICMDIGYNRSRVYQMMGTIIKKLNANDITHAVAIAIRRGFIK